MTVRADAVDPERYSQGSPIRSYLLAAPPLLQAAVHERWSVKTATDADAQALTAQAPTPTTIAALVALPVPALLPPDGRSDGAEKTVFELQATLTTYRAESDGDLHLVLADAAGTTMIGEIPNPADITGTSAFADQIAQARTAFDAHFGVTAAPNQPPAPLAAPAQVAPVNVPVTVTGVGFFDFAHHQLGVASNAIELHPVIKIDFQG